MEPQMNADERRNGNEKLNKSPSRKRRRMTPFAAFSNLESERQTEWLFRRHRPKRPAWKRD